MTSFISKPNQRKTIVFQLKQSTSTTHNINILPNKESILIFTTSQSAATVSFIVVRYNRTARQISTDQENSYYPSGPQTNC